MVAWSFIYGMSQARLWAKTAAGLILCCHSLGQAASGDPLLEADLPPLSIWSQSVTLRAASGYKDNVLLSHLGAQASAFWLTGLDAMVFRLPTDGREFSFMFSGEDIRYFSSPDADHEQTFFALAQGRVPLGDGWDLGLAAQYFYEDQVLDVSATETGLGTILVRGHGLTLRPGLRRDLGHGVMLEVEFEANRQYLAAPLDDYWEGGPKLALRKSYGNRSEIGLSYEMDRRFYDHRPQLDEFGFELAGTSLAFQTQRTELLWHQNWDHDRHWGSTLRGGVDINRDNSSGYFDFKKYFVSAQMSVDLGTWHFQPRAVFGVYDYDVQVAGFTDTSYFLRRKMTLLLNCRVEKQLSRKLKVFGEVENERSQGNEDDDKYRVNRVFGGLSWDF